MDLHFDDDPAAFLTRAGDHLAADPVLNTVVASIAMRARDERAAGVDGLAPGSWFCTVADDTGVLGVAMRTGAPPQRALYLLPMPLAATTALATALHRRGETVSAANGALPAVRQFADETARLSGGEVAVHAHTRLFRLDALVEPRPAPGRLRPAAPADADLVGRWLVAFHGDADAQAGRRRGATPVHHTADEVRRRIDQGRVWLWEVDGVPVHLTGAAEASYGARRIGPVYTPAEHRGHGYASAAVAGVSRLVIAAGVLPCLFTDQANPTSNAIYTALGYRPVTDMVNLIITPAANL